MAGTKVRYSLCAPWPDDADLAKYDEDDNIYLSKRSANRPHKRSLLDTMGARSWAGCRDTVGRDLDSGARRSDGAGVEAVSGTL